MTTREEEGMARTPSMSDSQEPASDSGNESQENPMKEPEETGEKPKTAGEGQAEETERLELDLSAKAEATDVTEETEESGRMKELPAEHPEASGAGLLEAQTAEPLQGQAAGSRLKPILEALIFCSEAPLSMDRLSSLVDGCGRRDLRGALDELIQDYRDRQGALEIVEVANGFQVRTRPEFGSWVARLRQQRPARLSRAALEVAAIVAYRQPATRAEIESIRGVDCAAAIGSLLEKRLVRIVGRKEVAGRPILYGTTQEFLELFGLKNLKSLPTLREIEGMFQKAEADSKEASLFENPPAGGAAREVSQISSVGTAVEASEPGGEGEPLRGGEEGETEEEGVEILMGGRESIDDFALRETMDDVLKRAKTRFVRYEEMMPQPTEGEGGPKDGDQDQGGSEDPAGPGGHDSNE